MIHSLKRKKKINLEANRLIRIITTIWPSMKSTQWRFIYELIYLFKSHIDWFIFFINKNYRKYNLLSNKRKRNRHNILIKLKKCDTLTLTLTKLKLNVFRHSLKCWNIFFFFCLFKTFFKNDWLHQKFCTTFHKFQLYVVNSVPQIIKYRLIDLFICLLCVDIT